MSALFPDRRFAGFGPSRFDPATASPALHFVMGRQTAALRHACGTSVRVGPASTAWWTRAGL